MVKSSWRILAKKVRTVTPPTKSISPLMKIPRNKHCSSNANNTNIKSNNTRGLTVLCHLLPRHLVPLVPFLGVTIIAHQEILSNSTRGLTVLCRLRPHHLAPVPSILGVITVAHLNTLSNSTRGLTAQFHLRPLHLMPLVSLLGIVTVAHREVRYIQRHLRRYPCHLYPSARNPQEAPR